MKITLCGSITFIDEMVVLKKELEKLGHEAHTPVLEFQNEKGNLFSAKEFQVLRKSDKTQPEWVWKRKKEAMLGHYDEIVWSDAILVCNYDKNDIPGYIGANTLLEMGLAFYLKKPIYLLNPIPEISYKEEILGMWPIVIDGDLNKIV
ncbi:MAG: hypothetical protein WAU28_05495 [Candidatus Moraniibacteriota bacterium]